MRYGSVCSGIEAASVAWHPLGWTPVFFSEIDPFCRAVLKARWPDVPNFGDMTRFAEWPDAVIDVLVGGTPCQSFSVAGLRGGLADPRGDLMLTFGAVARRYRPRWICWENVPGVLSSNGGRDFGAFLGMLGELGYGFAYRVLDAQYVRVDSHARAVPQRRRRVFVVGHLGDWRRAAAVLFERESLSGHPAPRRTAGKAAPTVPSRSTAGGGLGTDFDGDGGLIADALRCNRPGEGGINGDDTHIVPTVSPALNTVSGYHHAPGTRAYVAHALRADGFDASEDGTGRGTPLIAFRPTAGTHSVEARTDVSPSLKVGSGLGIPSPPAIAFDTTQITHPENRSNPQPGDPCHPLAAGAHPPAVAFDWQAGGSGDTSFRGKSRSYTVRTEGKAGSVQANKVEGVFLPTTMAVRRLTPRECERLQGFPDDYTLIARNGKPAADGPRYKALGNSFAVNVVSWIGQRIQLVEDTAAFSSATASP